MELTPEELSTFFNDTLSSDIQSFKIGEPFPWKDYAYPGDHCHLVPNSEGFDAVISLQNITEHELEAVRNNDVTISIMESNGIPFFVFDFVGFAVDFSLNILKTKELYQKIWLSNTNNEYPIKVFVLEGTDATLLTIRFLPFKGMQFVRDICKKQIGRAKEEIDYNIRLTQSRYDLPAIVSHADAYFKIKGGATI